MKLLLTILLCCFTLATTVQAKENECSGRPEVSSKHASVAVVHELSAAESIEKSQESVIDILPAISSHVDTDRYFNSIPTKTPDIFSIGVVSDTPLYIAVRQILI